MPTAAAITRNAGEALCLERLRSGAGSVGECQQVHPKPGWLLTPLDSWRCVGLAPWL
jgi:hypothetical protein